MQKTGQLRFVHRVRGIVDLEERFQNKELVSAKSPSSLLSLPAFVFHLRVHLCVIVADRILFLRGSIGSASEREGCFVGGKLLGG